MSWKHTAAVGWLVLGAGCLGSTEPFATQREYAFLVMRANPSEAGYTTDPIALFYRSAPLLLPRPQVTFDTCLVVPQARPPGNATPIYLDAGSPVTLALSGQTATLQPVVNETATQYKLPNNEVLPFTPGDTVQLTVPGAPNGFVGFTIKGKTAEPFTLDPVADEQVTDGVLLTWSPAPPQVDRDSKMIIELKYVEIQGNQIFEGEVYCELIDDGQHEVDPALLSGWRSSEPAERQVAATRWRVTTQGIGDTGLAQIISVFEVEGSLAP